VLAVFRLSSLDGRLAGSLSRLCSDPALFFVAALSVRSSPCCAGGTWSRVSDARDRRAGAGGMPRAQTSRVDIFASEPGNQATFPKSLMRKDAHFRMFAVDVGRKADPLTPPCNAISLSTNSAPTRPPTE
jgi:hypothetical protein